ncbi:MAG: ankyrin repeat domain-containing protein [Roseiflexaceae bacterium]
MLQDPQKCARRAWSDASDGCHARALRQNGRHAGISRCQYNIRDDLNHNPFLYAGTEGLLDMLQLTITAGANTRNTIRFGGTALIPAAERGHVAVVEALLTRTNVDVNHSNNLGWTALLKAIILSDGGLRHQKIVQLLIGHHADVIIADKDGVTPLQQARKRGFAEIARLLAQAAAH